MSEFCLDPSMTKKSHDLLRIVLPDFYIFCSFIFSHPLYFFYFVFFSPHLYKLFSFLSPLFLTTSLLLLALLTVSPGLLHDNNRHYHNVPESETDGHEFQHFEFEELEVYKIVFEEPSFEVREENSDEVVEVKDQEACEEEPVDKCVIQVGSEVPAGNSDNISGETLWPGTDQKIVTEVPTGDSETKNNSDIISDEALWQEIDQKIVSEVPAGDSETKKSSVAISDEALWPETDQTSVSEVPTDDSETRNSSDTISDEALWAEIDQKFVSEVPTYIISDKALWPETNQKFVSVVPTGNSETKNNSDTISDDALWPEIDQKIGSEVPTGNSETNNNSYTISDEALWPEIDQKIEEKKFLKENEGVENLSWERKETEEKEVKPLNPESKKVAQQPLKRTGSNANHNDHDNDFNLVHFQSPRTRFESTNRVQDPTLGSFGSMRKEKEWKRTLACKLFEERHNSGVGTEGGMDVLWETYEAESTKGGVAESYEEEDDDVAGQLCCLQALKFSTGKMNLGMRRSGLVKFSKALRGMGWLHHVGKSSKKVHH